MFKKEKNVNILFCMKANRFYFQTSAGFIDIHAGICYLILFKSDPHKKIKSIREDTNKKNVFLVVGTLRFYPPYTNSLVVHAIFFLVLHIIV